MDVDFIERHREEINLNSNQLVIKLWFKPLSRLVR